MRILLLRLSAIGDVINTLPAVSAIRKAYPNAYLAFVVEDKARDVVEGHPDIDRVFVFPRKRWRRALFNPRYFPNAVREQRQLFREMRAERFDLALDFQGNLKSTVHLLASGAQKKIGFARGHGYGLNYLFSDVSITPPGRQIHRVEKFMSLAGALGIDSTPGPYKIAVSDASIGRVTVFLKENDCEKYVILHPGTSRSGRKKRWPPERFAALARLIQDQFGIKVIVTWGSDEEALAAQVAREGRAVLSMKTSSLLDLAELIRRARLFVSCDTGPMHLAAACGTPCVSLFGPKDPVIYRPYGKQHRVLRKSDGRDSMLQITVQDVFAAVREMDPLRTLA